MNKELYTRKCPDCNKTFRTDDPKQKCCSTCQKYRKPCLKHRKPQIDKKPLTIAEISHIAEVYYRVHHKYLKYGEVVHLVETNAEHCVCCGATIPEGRQICPKCENT